jgi:Flp pilus assembly protein TadB
MVTENGQLSYPRTPCYARPATLASRERGRNALAKETERGRNALAKETERRRNALAKQTKRRRNALAKETKRWRDANAPRQSGARAPLEHHYHHKVTGDMLAYFIGAFAGSFTFANFSISTLRNCPFTFSTRRM